MSFLSKSALCMFQLIPVSWQVFYKICPFFSMLTAKIPIHAPMKFWYSQ